MKLGNKKQEKIFIKPKKKITQKAIAEKHGVCEGYISQIINGQKPVPEYLMKDVCKLLNLQIN